MTKQKQSILSPVRTLLLAALIGFAFMIVPPANVAAEPAPELAAKTGPLTCPDGTIIIGTSAKDCEEGDCPKPKFFGLIPWYEYLRLNKDCDVASFQFLPSGDVKSDIPLVLLAVVDDLLRITGLLAVGYVIYGGILYIVSQGNPDGTAKAQGTIVNALIGLAVAVVAVVGVNFLGRALGG